MNYDKINLLYNKIDSVQEYVEKLKKNYLSADNRMLQKDFEGTYQQHRQVGNLLEQIKGVVDITIKNQQQNPSMDKVLDDVKELRYLYRFMNVETSDMQMCNTLNDYVSQVIQMEKAVENKELSEADARKYVEAILSPKIKNVADSYRDVHNMYVVDSHKETFDACTTVTKFIDKFVGSLSQTNDSPKLTSEQVEEICKVSETKHDNSNIEKINAKLQLLDKEIIDAQQSSQIYYTDEILDKWMSDLGVVEECLNSNLYYSDELQNRISKMQGRISEFQFYAQKENNLTTDKVDGLDIIHKKIKGVTSETEQEINENISSQSNILLDKLNIQIQQVASLENMPSEMAELFDKYTSAQIKQIEHELVGVAHFTGRRINEQVQQKCKSVNETRKAFFSGQTQNL